MESKGAYVKPLSKLDYDLPIVNKALREYMIHGTPVETTINECDELIQFQKIVKLSSKYARVEWYGHKYTNKCYRVFATNLKYYGSICKVKVNKGSGDKFANTPEYCYLDNGDIRGKKPYNFLDRNWYIELAHERLRQFGGE